MPPESTDHVSNLTTLCDRQPHQITERRQAPNRPAAENYRLRAKFRPYSLLTTSISNLSKVRSPTCSRKGVPSVFRSGCTPLPARSSVICG
jgi:hypothetical protein